MNSFHTYSATEPNFKFYIFFITIKKCILDVDNNFKDINLFMTPVYNDDDSNVPVRSSPLVY